jgi:hypothetical protein
MSRMLDLVRASKLSYHQMNTASRGALHVPASEMVEILVYLAEHNKIFADTARLTLASWDEDQSKAIAADPATSKEVLDYWLAANNIRPALFPILIENPAVRLSKLTELSPTLKGELVDVMIASPRVRGSVQLLRDLSTNHNLSGAQAARVQALIGGNADPTPVDAAAEKPAVSNPPATIKTEQIQAPAQADAPPAASVSAVSDAAAANQLESAPADDPEAETALVTFFKEHASEIAAEADKPFQPLGGFHEELPAEEPKAVAAAAAAAAHASEAAAKPAVHKKLVNPQDEQRGSTLQKINKLDVKGRIQLAVKGTKEERSILIRDGTKIVALAVLDSPKITDGEVEKFATQKNVLEAVLRAIIMKRRFAKNYAIVRNLVFNPRTPLDVALGLMKNLLTADLKNLSGNKEVPETVRKLALRMFKQKSEKKD